MALVALIVCAATGIDAHKGVTSKYTYNEDVFPILRDKCGRCHVEGGPTPMSLLKYDIENGERWRGPNRCARVLVSEAMPPWYADPTGPAVKNDHKLTPRELDIIVNWAVGGTPRGDINKNPAPMTAQVGLGARQARLEIPMDKPHVVSAGAMEETVDFTLATNLKETNGSGRWTCYPVPRLW